MKKKHSIVFISGILLLTALLSAGYKKSYEAAKERRRISCESAGKDAEKESAPAKAEVRKNRGFYICERDGRVIVYLEDRKTVFETTGIYLWELPREVREEIKKGKYVRDEKQLYGFLENYTS